MEEKKEKQKTIEKLSLVEKATLLQGDSPKSTHAYPEKGVRKLILMDGPNGLRRSEEKGDSLGGIADSSKTTCFPCGTLLASTWDRKRIGQVGKAIGKECLFYGTDVLLGPAVNIQRNPLCGRNFEYYSEDPLLSGEMGAAFVEGVQENHVGTAVKHFCCNNNEKMRFIGDSLVDERAFHEIYLKSFEIVVRKAHPYCLMNAYNLVNGTHASENDLLNNKILREDWGFKGVVMTDWGGIVDRVKALKAGTDLEMPGEVVHNTKLLVDGVREGKLDEKVIDESVIRLLDLMDKTKDKEKVEDSIFKENEKLATEVASEGAVLLKNDGILPLDKTKHYLVVGPMFSNPRYQGSGSSLLNAYSLTTHKDAFEKRHIEYDYAKGYDLYNDVEDETLLQEALEKAKKADVILFYGGQNDFVESEGYDRETMRLPKNQINLIKRLAETKKPIVFLLFTGSPVELPFENRVNAVLDMFLAGEGIGEATTRLLFGECSPCGKLTETFPMSYKDVPFGKDFTKKADEFYKESIYVGYRYYLTAKKEVRYPFGYGLSYTKFSYSDLVVKEEDGNVVVHFAIENVGDRDGAEIAQVYLRKRNSAFHRPLKELKGFEKVFLKKGEKKKIAIAIPKEELQVFDSKAHRWILEDGEFLFEVGSSSCCTKLSQVFFIEGERRMTKDDELAAKYYHRIENLTEMTDADFLHFLSFDYTPIDVDRKPYTMETPIFAYRTWFGKIFRKAVCAVGNSKVKKARKLPEGPKREREEKAGYFIVKLMPNNSLRSLSFSSSGGLSYNIAEAVLDMINNHPIKALKKMLKKEEIDDGQIESK